MKTKFMPSIVLTAICLVVAALLSVVNMFTGPEILAAQEEAANAALVEVLPGGTGFEDVTAEYQGKLPASVKKATKASNGYVFQMEVTGYKPGFIIMCGIGSDGKVTGTKYIQSNETLGAEDAIAGVFDGADINSISPDLVAGPTAKLTTMAYYGAIVDALNSFAIIGGADVDLRTPEQIIDDSCNEACGTDSLDFSATFVWGELEGVDSVYAREGYRVYLVGESYVGVNAEGEIITAGVDEGTTATVTAAEAVYSSLKTEDISSLTGATKRAVKEAYSTEGGYYLFTLSAAGYSVNAPSYAHTSGTYIIVKLVISPDGAIESVKTISQDESEGIGDACATDDYVSEYEGLTDADITVIGDGESQTSTAPGVISGATLTSRGYQTAIKEAFKAYELLKGDGRDE
ncbi:MAG: FMN-binding protein [Clostridia bacterium]|nr:FMN-binding protein [Clostridia bacterium]